MRITPTRRGKTVATIAAGTLFTAAAVTLFTLEPSPRDTHPVTHETPVVEPATAPPVDVYEQSWTPEELLMTCDNDYEVGSDVWESCVDVVFTATCLFEPFPVGSEWFTSADARCSGGRVTSSTPVITD